MPCDAPRLHGAGSTSFRRRRPVAHLRRPDASRHCGNDEPIAGRRILHRRSSSTVL
ncbi:Hypothetical protein I596_1358 [Dokdonella koreensis DS-123]|uniref:Uncharacterized protein n=1 Tax=Dokdonella koreensis DS-123 TaxID=1300342 RepID=A0A161HJQ3_9GAMM|nr:Hypothetical protein I596_1358 [Dokdonella koreensis DS-123]